MNTNSQTQGNASIETAKSVVGFLSCLNNIRKKHKTADKDPVLAFRGHYKDSYLLKPGIARIEEYTVDKERSLFFKFKRSYHSYIVHHPSSDLDLLSLAQHYGLATRILDWSLNPLVALFFACFSEHADSKEQEADGQVLIKVVSHKDEDFREDPNPEDGLGWYDFLYPGENEGGERKEKSEPVFIFPDNFDVRFRHQSGIFEYYSSPTEEGQSDAKIKIPKDAKQQILKELDELGINEAFIYPDLEHFSKYLSNKYRKVKDDN